VAPMLQNIGLFEPYRELDSFHNGQRLDHARLASLLSSA
jgi:hypothetical protein